jgi:hypothetical protein
LFAETAFEKQSDVLKAQQRLPITLEPSVEAVIELLQSAEK